MPWLAVLESEINPYLGIGPCSSLEASRSYLLEQGLDPNRAKMWCVSHPCLPPRSLQEREEILSAILVPSLGRCPYGACFHLSENTTRSLRSKLGHAAVRLDFPALSAHGAGPFPVPAGTLLLTALWSTREVAPLQGHVLSSAFPCTSGAVPCGPRAPSAGIVPLDLGSDQGCVMRALRSRLAPPRRQP